MAADADRAGYQGFALGEPSLVCRWRLTDGWLPLENRHLRALGRRRLGGEPVSTRLIAWAKQHLEWTLADGSRDNPDGVLMLVIDDAGQAAMSIGPYRPLPDVTLAALIERARAASAEARQTGVAPETLWAVAGRTLVRFSERGLAESGAASLVSDLANTTGLRRQDDPLLLERLAQDRTFAQGAFLASDEHGVVVASGFTCERAEKFAQGYAKLLASRRRQGAGGRHS